MSAEHEHVASISSTLTALAVAVGRLEEQMKAVRDDLLHHTREEHKSFNEALAVVQEIKDDVSTLQSLIDQSKGAWWLLAKFGAVLLAISGIVIGIFELLTHK